LKVKLVFLPVVHCVPSLRCQQWCRSKVWVQTEGEKGEDGGKLDVLGLAACCIVCLLLVQCVCKLQNIGVAVTVSK
jgi:hypothetical protein